VVTTIADQFAEKPVHTGFRGYPLRLYSPITRMQTMNILLPRLGSNLFGVVDDPGSTQTCTVRQ
jgi:hypothetical protein